MHATNLGDYQGSANLPFNEHILLYIRFRIVDIFMCFWVLLRVPLNYTVSPDYVLRLCDCFQYEIST